MLVCYALVHRWARRRQERGFFAHPTHLNDMLTAVALIPVEWAKRSGPPVALNDMFTTVSLIPVGWAKRSVPTSCTQ